MRARFFLGVSVGFLALSGMFGTLMAIRIVTGEGDYKYDAIMGMLNLIAAMVALAVDQVRR